MFQRVLIANRGEIAVRLIQACHDLELETVAVFSEADRSARHVDLATHSVCIGPASASRSYLDQDAILTVAQITEADAVHPGYGFLAENAHFARRVREQGLTWIGPDPDTIVRMGDKAAARRTAVEADVPVLPGTPDPPPNAAEARRHALEIGFPLLLKAVSGGGGKGMRRVDRESDLERQFETASREADAAFGDARIYLERFARRPRHVEVQVFAEHDGKVSALGARECSIQRRHQKLLEESPPPGVEPSVLEAMFEASIRLAESVDYRGAGTVEFLLEPSGEFYFMEMNTRIQVEHTVTEMVWSADLVAAQLLCAQGRASRLPATPQGAGHAIECRINAEDPRSFAPSPGRIEHLVWPLGPGVRIDTHVYPGYRFPPFYDSLLAKFIAYGQDRAQAIARMRRALGEFEIEGIATTAPLHQRILEDSRFLEGRLDTSFLDGLPRSW